MATTIWSNKELYHWGNTGYIKMDATYTYSRDGADMLYTINVTVKQTGSQAFFNDSVGCQIKLNGTEVYKNTTLKSPLMIVWPPIILSATHYIFLQ